MLANQVPHGAVMWSGTLSKICGLKTRLRTALHAALSHAYSPDVFLVVPEGFLMVPGGFLIDPVGS